MTVCVRCSYIIYVPFRPGARVATPCAALVSCH